jgi:hypothetical protein
LAADYHISKDLDFPQFTLFSPTCYQDGLQSTATRSTTELPRNVRIETVVKGLNNMGDYTEDYTLAQMGSGMAVNDPQQSID